MMLGLSLIRTNYTKLRGLWTSMRWFPAPSQAEGD